MNYSSKCLLSLDDLRNNNNMFPKNNMLELSNKSSTSLNKPFGTSIKPKKESSAVDNFFTLPNIYTSSGDSYGKSTITDDNVNINDSAHNLLKHYRELKNKGFPSKKNDLLSVIKRKMRAKNNGKPALSKLYGVNRREEYIYKKLKNNNKIAYKNDFNVEEYQTFLADLYKDRLSIENYNDLKKKNINLNKISKPKHYDVHIQKNGWYYLAKDLEYQLPTYLYNKFISLGITKLNNKNASH